MGTGDLLFYEGRGIPVLVETDGICIFLFLIDEMSDGLSLWLLCSVDYFTTGFFCLWGLWKRFGRLSSYFAHVVSSISLTFCYLLKQSSLFSFKRSVK